MTGRNAPGQVLPRPTYAVRYGHSEGTAALLPTNERGGAWFMHHDRDPGFGPMCYSVSATACEWIIEGHTARFVWDRDRWPGYSLTCDCGWSHGNGVWADLRAALIAHFA